MSNEAQSHIDDEITRLTSSLYDLRSQRNALSYISRLPIEVLGDIFVHCASDYHYQEHHPPLRSDAPDWVNVSYVCRQWRNVALDCPTLWTYVFVSSQRWTELLLARSKQESLKIRIKIDHPLEKWWRFLRTVADHVERIQELCLLRGNADGETSPLLTPFTRIPRLQVMEFDGCGSYPTHLEIFRGAIPTLRTLIISKNQMPSCSSQLSGLTSLSLENMRDHGRLDIVELRSLLGCMHDLAHLHLWNALCGADRFLSSEDFDVTQKFTLPLHLSRLLIAAPLSTIVAFLSYFKIASETDMKLLCFGERPTFQGPWKEIFSYDEENYLQNDCCSLYSLLAQRLCSPGDQALFGRIRTLSIHCSDRELVFSSSERYGRCPRLLKAREVYWDCDIPLQLSIKFTSIMRSGGLITSNICRSVPPKDVRSVHICSLEYCSTLWTISLAHFQEVRHLKATDCNITGLFSALSLVSPHDAENQEGHVDQHLRCAPALEELECISCWIDKRQGIPAGFRTALSIRKERGRALKRLIIKDDVKNAFRPEDVLGLPVGGVSLNGQSY